MGHICVVGNARTTATRRKSSQNVRGIAHALPHGMSLRAHRSLRLLAMLAIVIAHLLPRAAHHVARSEAPAPATTLASF
jgi:hypothetical protein